MRVTPAELAEAMDEALEDYGEEVRENVAAAVMAAGASALERVKELSPKRTGKYRKSWRKKVTGTAEKPTVTVYNYKYYNLVHLLEFGHAKKEGGRVEGHPHVEPTVRRAERELEAAIRKAIEEG